MKAQILKLGGVTTEAEFYKKFPTEEAFMAKHGKELKKAQNSAVLKKAPVNIQSTTGAMDKSIAKEQLTKEQQLAAAKTAKDKQMNSFLKQGLTALPGIVGGFQTLSEEQDQLNKYNALAKIADLTSQIKPAQQYAQKIVRPEDSRTDPGEMYNPLGDPNFNYLSRNGSEIGGNPTEIQNMYNPGDIYDDLGFEPLADSNIKRFQGGGTIDYAKFAPSLSALGSSAGSAFSGGKFKSNTAGETGSTIGGLIGTGASLVTGIPGLDVAGNLVGGVIGGWIGGEDAQEMEEKRNKGMGLVGTAGVQNFWQGANSAVARNGADLQEAGYMNPNYNPQVIAKFGDYDVDQLFAPPHDADMLRAGGHLKQYTPPSASAMYTGRDLPYQMANGGKLQSSTSDGELHALWGGGFKPLSYNPVTGTQTDLAVGNSHDQRDSRTGETGIGVGYEEGGTIDNAVAEIENEPVVSMQNGGDTGTKLVGGALVNPLTGRQFKKDIKDNAMKEQKQNKILEKSAAIANKTKTYTAIDKIGLNTAKAMQIGATMKLAKLGAETQEFAILQNAIKDTAQEFGYKAADLAKGKITQLQESDVYGRDGLTLAKGGANLKSLGDLAKLYQAAIKTKDAMAIGKFQKAALATLGKDEVKKITGAKNFNKFVDGKFGPSTNALGKAVTQKLRETVTPTTEVDPNAPIQYAPEVQAEYAPNVQEWMPADTKNFIPGMSDAEMAAFRERNKPGKPTKDNTLGGVAASAANSLIPLIQGNKDYNLDPNQLLGERYALLNNQQEPVFAQSYTPELISPYSIGADDQINQVTSEANAAYRLMQNNPELAGNAAAQAYNAKNQIRSKVSQANQEQRFNTIKSNTDTLNQAKIANIQLFGDQSDKMAGAKANTAKQTEAALQSIGAKIAQAKNEQMQFNVARATFPAFSYTPSGQAYKNPYYNAFFNKNGVGSGKSKGTNGTMEDESGNTLLPQYDPYGNIKGYTVKKTKATASDDTEDVLTRNGGNLARAIKNL